jgi:cell division protein FtsA
MNTNTNPIIVGLDIGTTKIAAIAGRKNEFGKLEILGFGKSQSYGVEHGQVLNIEEAVKAIKQALDGCYKSNPDLEVNEVYVGVAGYHIKSLQTTGAVVLQGEEWAEITEADVTRLIEDQRKTLIPAGDQIIDIIPQDFAVDNNPKTTNPVGCCGVKVGANFHIVTGDKNAIRNINRAVERSGLKTKDLMLQPLASAAAVMCDEDLEAGVAIIDIGGGTTDLAVFYDGVLRHTAVIPFGGENITNDIKMGLGVLKAQAELMKVKFGSALATEAKQNEYITIPGFRGLPAREVSVVNLANIIQARMVEILNFVKFHLKQAHLDTNVLNGGLIITGGGSQLKDLIQLASFQTGLNARIGFPNEHLAVNHIKELEKPMYATCLGLIIKGYAEYERIQRANGINMQFDTLTETTPNNNAEDTAENKVVTVDIVDNTAKISIVKKRLTMKSLVESFKTGLSELFKEEQDKSF